MDNIRLSHCSREYIMLTEDCGKATEHRPATSAMRAMIKSIQSSEGDTAIYIPYSCVCFILCIN